MFIYGVPFHAFLVMIGKKRLQPLIEWVSNVIDGCDDGKAVEGV